MPGCPGGAGSLEGRAQKHLCAPLLGARGSGASSPPAPAGTRAECPPGRGSGFSPGPRCSRVPRGSPGVPERTAPPPAPRARGSRAAPVRPPSRSPALSRSSRLTQAARGGEREAAPAPASAPEAAPGSARPGRSRHVTGAARSRAARGPRPPARHGGRGRGRGLRRGAADHRRWGRGGRGGAGGAGPRGRAAGAAPGRGHAPAALIRLLRPQPT